MVSLATAHDLTIDAMVEPWAPVKVIEPGPAVEEIVLAISLSGVVPRASEKPITPGTTREAVSTLQPVQVVLAATSGDVVGAGPAEDRVVPRLPP